MTVVRFIESLSGRLNQAGLAVMLPGMVAIVTVGVVMRKLFNAPLPGKNEIVGFALAVVVYFSMSYCWITKGHVRLELVINRFKPRVRQGCEALGAALWLLFFGFLLWWLISWDIPRAFLAHDVSIDARIPLWPVKALIASGCFVFCLQLLSSLIIAITKVAKR